MEMYLDDHKRQKGTDTHADILVYFHIIFNVRMWRCGYWVIHKCQYYTEDEANEIKKWSNTYNIKLQSGSRF